MRDSEATCKGVGLRVTALKVMKKGITAIPSAPRKYMKFCGQLHSAVNLLTPWLLKYIYDV